MSRFSSILIDDTAQDAFMEEAEKRMAAMNTMDHVQAQASVIFQILVGSKNFRQTFVVNSLEDLHLFTFLSKRVIVLDVLTRCSSDQVSNFDTYKFTAHPTFEKKISAYTKSAEKPNQQLSKSRSWDVALNVILKVEALDSTTACLPNARLLFREYNILKYVWDSYLRENLDLDEMTGIPMVFDYTEVPNQEFNYETAVEYKVVDVHGNLIPWKSDNSSTLSYMSMEKLGPNLQYLQDLMLHSRRKSRTFDLETSFKVFDQLICRLLQLHRFGVAHNCVEPRNVYFGRSIAFNVVYLGNYSRSMILDSKAQTAGKTADVFMGGDPRYMSQFCVRGAPVNSMQDIEAAFYTLLSMIVTNLPWDIYLVKNNDTPRWSVESKNNTDIHEDFESQSNVREMKLNFWKSVAGINRVIADIRYLTVGSESVHVNLITEIVKDLYSKLRDQFLTVKTKRRSSVAGSLLSSQSSNEYQFYLELRRTTLLFFRFESISVSLCTGTYQKKIEAITRDEVEPRPAWNISNWCFNVVQMSAPRTMRLSMRL